MSILETQKFREDFRLHHIPKYYSGLVHLAFTSITLVGLCLFCLSLLSQVTWQEWLMIPLMLVNGNLFVFVVHKYLLHRPQPGLKFVYKVHSLHHHHFFTDELIVYDSWRDFYILLFPPYVVIAVGFVMGPFFGTLVGLLWTKNAGVLICLGHYLYFILYEVFHFVSHLPQDHWIMKCKPFAYMREHHRLHHRLKLMAHYNFNIVYPLADKLFGTHYTHEKNV